MTRQQLLARLAYFTNPANGIGAVLYFILLEGGEPVIRLADIEDDAKNELKDRFLETINDLFINNPDLQYRNISEADQRKDVVYYYDLDEPLTRLDILGEVLANEEQPFFQFQGHNLQQVQGYLITIGNEANRIALYKKHYPVNLLKRDRFLLVPAGQRLVSVTQDAIALDRNFEFMMVDDNLIVLKLTVLERFFGFDEVIRNQAEETITAIGAHDILQDIAQLTELSQDMGAARKLMKLRNSPVLNIPVDRIIHFIQGHTALAGKIQFNEAGDRIKLDTIQARKLFLKVLNDDYLFSQLSELSYDTHAKDALTPGGNGADGPEE